MPNGNVAEDVVVVDVDVVVVVAVPVEEVSDVDVGDALVVPLDVVVLKLAVPAVLKDDVVVELVELNDVTEALLVEDSTGAVDVVSASVVKVDVAGVVVAGSVGAMLMKWCNVSAATVLSELYSEPKVEAFMKTACGGVL